MFDIANTDARLTLGLRCTTCHQRIVSLHTGCVIYAVPLEPGHASPGVLAHRVCMERAVKQLRGDAGEDDEHIPVRVISLEVGLEVAIKRLFRTPVTITESPPAGAGMVRQKIQAAKPSMAFPS